MQPRHWTSDQLAFLEKHYHVEGGKFVAKHLRISESRVHAKAVWLKLGNPRRRNWEVWEIAYHRNWYGVKPTIDICTKLGRSLDSVELYAERHTLCQWNAIAYSKREIAFLRKYYPTMAIKDIAKRLRRTIRSVINEASRIGVHKAPKHQWSDKDRDILIRGYGHVPTRVLAKQIGTTYEGIKRMAHYMDVAGERMPSYTPEEHDYIRKHCWKMKTEDIARQLGRSAKGIYLYAMRQGWTGRISKRRLGVKLRQPRVKRTNV